MHNNTEADRMLAHQHYGRGEIFVSSFIRLHSPNYMGLHSTNVNCVGGLYGEHGLFFLFNSN